MRNASRNVRRRKYNAEKKVQCGEGSNLYIRKNVRKLPEQMLKIRFSNRAVRAVSKVGENSIFFLALFLSTDQSRNYAMSLEDVKPLVTQNYISSS